MKTPTFISPLIESQFPDLYRTEGPGFIAFVKAYYEFLEQENAISESRNLLTYRDIDTTLDKFIDSFKFKYLSGLPGRTKIADKKLLLKHIKEIYSSKGTQRGLELLFRILFDADTQLTFPADSILRPSDGDWVVPVYAEITHSPNNYLLVGENVLGRNSGATAYVEDVQTIYYRKRRTDVLRFANLVGSFQAGEQVFSEVIPNALAPVLVGSLSNVENFGISFGYKVGDVVEIEGGSGFGGKAVVTAVSPRDGTLTFEIENGGTGYSIEFTTLELQQLPGSSGSGAAARVSRLTNTTERVVCLNPLFHQLLPANFVANVEQFYYKYSTPDVGVYSLQSNTVEGFIVASNVRVANTTSNTYATLSHVKEAAVVDTPQAGTLTITSGSRLVSGNGATLTNAANGSVIRVDPGYYFSVETSNTTAILLTTTPFVTLEDAGWSTRANVNLMVLSQRTNDSFEPAVGNFITWGAESGLTTQLSGTASFYDTNNTIVGTSTLFSSELLVNDVVEIAQLEFTVDTIVSNTVLNVTPLQETANIAAANVSVQGLRAKIDLLANNINANDFFTIDTLRWKSNVQIAEESFFLAVVPGVISFFVGSGEGVDYPVGSSVTVANGTASVTGTVIHVRAGANTVNSSNLAEGSADLVALEPASNSSFLVSTTQTITLNSNTDVNTAIIGDYTQSQVPLDNLLDVRNLTIGTIAELEIISQGSGYTGAVTVRTVDSVISGEAQPSPIGGLDGLNATITARAGSGQGAVDSVRILDSGYGYKQGDVITLRSETNANTLIGSVLATTHGTSEGRFISEKGFLSDGQYIQDNHFYQEFSYVIETEMSLNRYASLVRNLWHPAGTRMFGFGLFVDIGDMEMGTSNRDSYLITSNDAELIVGDYVVDSTTNGFGYVIEAAAPNYTVRMIDGVIIANTTLLNASTMEPVATVLTSTFQTLVDEDAVTIF